MTIILKLLYISFGLGVGLGVGWIHALASRRAALQVVEQRSGAWPLFGFPLRVAIPAGALFLLIFVDSGTLIGGLLGFMVGQGLGLSQKSLS